MRAARSTLEMFWLAGRNSARLSRESRLLQEFSNPAAPCWRVLLRAVGAACVDLVQLSTSASVSRGAMVNATISVIAMVNARLGTTGGINHVDPPGRRLVATLADYADPTRCLADPLCLRVHAMEPTMPIAPKLADGVVNPCIETKDGGLLRSACILSLNPLSILRALRPFAP